MTPDTPPSTSLARRAASIPSRASAGRRVRALVLVVVLAAGAAVGATALSELTGPAPALAQSASAASVPRMVSLGADEVNVRAGPGVRFPVKWVFRRDGMPVEITAEYDTWRKIRDWEGAEGWVHRAMLSGRRTVLVVQPEVTMRRLPEATAPAVARLAAGIVARLEGCEDGWCHVATRGYEGWLTRESVWGLGTGGTARAAAGEGDGGDDGR